MLALGACFSFIGKGEYFLLFFLPLVNSLPWFLPLKIPFNYIALSLYFLLGFLLARGMKEKAPVGLWPFLSILYIGALFLLLRWSNITLSPLAFLKDTPVAPGGPGVSFGIFLPSVSLFLVIGGSSAWGFFKNLKRDLALRVLSASTAVSVMIALVQMKGRHFLLPSGPWKWIYRYNGTFSDPNAAGIFSGILFVWILLRGTSLRDFLWSIPPLAMVFLSSSRTGLLMSFLGILIFFISKRVPGKLKWKTGLILTILLLVSSPHLWKRMGKYLKKGKNITVLTEGRNILLSRSIIAFKEAPLSGIGPGNFIFYVMYRFHRPKLNDVVPSVYFSVLAELGIIGFLLFLLFLLPYILSRPSPEKNLLWVVLFSFFFHTFLWFPETVLIFFFLLSGLQTKRIRIPAGVIAGIITIFVGAGILSFKSLHPATWSLKEGQVYSYGLYGKEENYRWTSGSCGLYWNFKGHLRISTDFPENTGRRVKIYWRGKHFKTVVLTPENPWHELSIKGRGFLDLRIYPVFIPDDYLKNGDKRKLGVKIFGLP